MASGYLLTESDREAIQNLLKERARNAVQPLRGSPQEDVLPTGPEVLVIRTPDDGIPALTDEDDVGTAPGPDRPGAAECQAYQVIFDDDDLEVLEPVDGMTRRVLNLGPLVTGRTWALAEKDKHGRWWVVPTAVSVGDVIEIRVADVTGGKFDCWHLSRDNAAEEWVQDAEPVWGIDLAEASSLTEGDRYTAEREGAEVGGPFFVSIIDDNTGNDLADTGSWLQASGNPSSPIPYVPSIVNVVNAVNGALSIVAGSAPADFSSTLSIDIVDANSSITAGDIWIIGTDAVGGPLIERITVAGGTVTYTTALSYKTVTSITVADLAGAVAGDTIRVTITRYSTGAIRTAGGITYLATNLAGAISGPPSADWTAVTPSNKGGYGTGEYNTGDYVQEVRLALAFRSSGKDDDSCCECGKIEVTLTPLDIDGGFSFDATEGTSEVVFNDGDSFGECTWICPPGVTKIMVDAFGCGGNGSWGEVGNPVLFNTDFGYWRVLLTNQSGGGGGGWSRKAITTIPGMSYTVRIEYNTANGSQFKLGAIALVRAPAGCDARDGYAAGIAVNHIPGGQASDGIGDAKSSGGEGQNNGDAGDGSFVLEGLTEAPYGTIGDIYGGDFADPGPVVGTSFSGSGGGSGGPQGNGSDGTSGGQGIYPNLKFAKGGNGYGNGGDGFSWQFNSILMPNFDTQAKNGGLPGGGGGGGSPYNSIGFVPPTNVGDAGYPGLGGYGLVRISWGRDCDTSLNGQTGAVTLAPSSGTGVAVTPAANSVLTLTGPLVDDKLPVPSGGTNRDTLTSGQLLAGDGTAAVVSATSTKVTSGELSLKGAANQWVKITAPASY